MTDTKRSQPDTPRYLGAGQDIPEPLEDARLRSMRARTYRGPRGELIVRSSSIPKGFDDESMCSN